MHVWTDHPNRFSLAPDTGRRSRAIAPGGAATPTGEREGGQEAFSDLSVVSTVVWADPAAWLLSQAATNWLSVAARASGPAAGISVHAERRVCNPAAAQLVADVGRSCKFSRAYCRHAAT